jgi:diguanylate cyclase (GGDEF)-like protein/PAS domain S-box-containing protein
VTALPEGGALRQLLAALPDALSLVDASSPDLPVVWVNHAFEQLTGYSAAELVGRTLRLLEGEDRDQPGLRKLRQAIVAGQETTALLHNVRRDGSAFWQQVHLLPLRDSAGRLTHWAGVHREAVPRAHAGRHAPRPDAAQLELVPRDDLLTGLHTRAWFESVLERDWGTARREGRRLALFVVDVDSLGSYNDTFGRAGGDACLKRVGRTLATGFKRASDLLARWEHGTFVGLAMGLDEAAATAHAAVLLGRVRDLHIHHPRSTVARYVTVSIGVATGTPGRDDAVGVLVAAGFDALRESQASGGDRTTVRGIEPVTRPA